MDCEGKLDAMDMKGTASLLSLLPMLSTLPVRPRRSPLLQSKPTTSQAPPYWIATIPANPMNARAMTPVRSIVMATPRKGLGTLL